MDNNPIWKWENVVHGLWMNNWSRQSNDDSPRDSQSESAASLNTTEKQNTVAENVKGRKCTRFEEIYGAAGKRL